MDTLAKVRASFSTKAAAEHLASKLDGVTVRIKGSKLHSSVRVSLCCLPDC